MAVDDALGDDLDPVADVGAQELPPPGIVSLSKRRVLPSLPAFPFDASHCWRRDWHLGLVLRLGPEALSLTSLSLSLLGPFPSLMGPFPSLMGPFPSLMGPFPRLLAQ